ncbi:putative MFS-type transporter YcxA [Paenibacillus marchantiophytorum]|uniref:MFS-type transporter YcxA n=1 Tax=Paenibacillus marchantiophytorum TaxID=1619310 RepID=A0ABQ1F6C6_9BACL|nr:MFS transporter [Paenibacillus marchantiophytorum]GGA00004.1 putative MFS-type transporter YcxA [Paenibacillus marchantiophytorum]
MGTTWFNESKYAWLGLGSLWIIGFISALTRFIMAYFQVQISEDLGISRGFISMAWSTNLLIAALCAPLGGWLVDRYGPKKIMLASAIMSTVGTGTVVFGHDSMLFFIGYGVISGFVGIGSTTTYMLMFKWFQHHRAKATALLASASSVGLAISTPIFVSSSWLTWKDAFLASFILGIIVTLPVIWFGIKAAASPNKANSPDAELQPVTKETQPEAESPPIKRAALYVPIFIVVSLALFTCGFNMGTVEMNLVAIHQLANVSPSMIALSMSVLGVLEITGSLLFGYFLDRLNKLMMMSILYGIRVLGFAFLFLHVGWSPLLFAIAFGITYLSAIPGGLLIINEFAKGKGQHTGFLLLFHQGGGILGALIGGLSFDYFHNYQVLIGVDVAICLLMTLSYFFVYTSRKRRPLVQVASSSV